MKLARTACAVGAVLACCAAACGNDAKSTATTTALGDTTPAATRTARPPASTDTPPSPPATATAASPTASPGPAGTRLEPAPVDATDLIIQESSPPQYAVHILSGLPSGCHVFDHATLTRTGSELVIEVMNRVPADPHQACTAIYGTHETNVQLGSDFGSGSTYRVQINEKLLEFTAQ